MMKKVLFLIFLFLLSVSETIACSPRGPDPWFSISISLEETKLPNNIQLQEYIRPYSLFAITNRGEIPFYIVKEDETDWQQFPNSELPKGFEPKLKIVNNLAYYYYQDEYEKPPFSGYKKGEGGPNNIAETHALIDLNYFELDQKIKNIYQDDRPEQVEVPSPQKVKLLAYYNNSPLQINGVLSYSLNMEYDPKMGAKGIVSCNSMKKSAGIIELLLIIILSIVIGGIILIVTIIKKKSIKK